MANELLDTAEALEAKETAKKLPAGWLVLFFGLIVWGAYYLWAYSPWAAGWSQEAEYQAAAQAGGAGTNVFGTIFFTALAAIAAAALIFRVSRRKEKR